MQNALGGFAVSVNSGGSSGCLCDLLPAAEEPFKGSWPSGHEEPQPK